MIEIHTGDCRQILPTLDAGSVQCCVTSPPYFGLRDYGTGTWDGGEASCDHIAAPHSSMRPERSRSTSTTFHGSMSTNHGKSAGTPYRATCGKCGAARVDQQIGLEPTVEAYVAEMVAVFREVRRILRPDGVLFLNLGDSYASSSSTRINYNLREDLTDEERLYVCVEMFGVRLNGDEAQSTRLVPEVLSGSVEGTAVREESAMASGGISESLRAPQGPSDRTNHGAQSGSQVGSDPPVGRDVRVLSGNDAGISNGRSHQRGWSGAPEADDGQVAGQLDHDLQGHTQARLSKGRVPRTVHELQPVDRCLGLLSSPIDERYVPQHLRRYFRATPAIKAKDLLGIPWRVAFALQADGWWLRSDCIWSKPNPMPESVRDRPTKAHEYVFLLTKSERYFWDADAVAEPQTWHGTRGGIGGKQAGANGNATYSGRVIQSDPEGTRNLRTVWTIATRPFKGSHFAVFPPDLAEICVKSGSRPGDAVLDPFGGAGTVGLVADRLGRDAVLIELNPDYAEMARQRIRGDAPLFAGVV